MGRGRAPPSAPQPGPTRPRPSSRAVTMAIARVARPPAARTASTPGCAPSSPTGPARRRSACCRVPGRSAPAVRAQAWRQRGQRTGSHGTSTRGRQELLDRLARAARPSRAQSSSSKWLRLSIGTSVAPGIMHRQQPAFLERHTHGRRGCAAPVSGSARGAAARSTSMVLNSRMKRGCIGRRGADTRSSSLNQSCCAGRAAGDELGGEELAERRVVTAPAEFGQAAHHLGLFGLLAGGLLRTRRPRA